jgi:hypothetical protein
MLFIAPQGLQLNVSIEPAFEAPEEISGAKRLERRLPRPA